MDADQLWRETLHTDDIEDDLSPAPPAPAVGWRDVGPFFWPDPVLFTNAHPSDPSSLSRLPAACELAVALSDARLTVRVVVRLRRTDLREAHQLRRIELERDRSHVVVELLDRSGAEDHGCLRRSGHALAAELRAAGSEVREVALPGAHAYLNAPKKAGFTQGIQEASASLGNHD